jgi:predicted nucleic acid-binding Zn ribbon protein
MRSLLIILQFVVLFFSGIARANDAILPLTASIASLGCENGSVPVPPGRILTWRPANCTAADGLIEIRNDTPGCIVPNISGVSRPKVVEAVGMNLAAIGFYKSDGRFLSCIPQRKKDQNTGNTTVGRYWMFLPTPMVTISGSGYTVPRDWHVTEVTIDAATGVPVVALNGMIGDVTKAAPLAFACSTVSFNAESDSELWINGLPVFTFQYTNCPH